MNARIVIRPGDRSGLLILGVLEEESPALKGGRVYEIRDIGGVLTIHDIGESAIATTAQYKGYENLGKTGHIESWATRYFDIIAKWGWWLVGTLTEARGLHDGDRSVDFVTAATNAPKIPERTG